MSRPLPPASGIPVKVVVRSADGRTADGFQMSQRMQGELQQFLYAARQKTAGLAVGGSVKQVTGGIAQFVTNNGQEQLIITLSPPGQVEAVEAQEPVQDIPTERPGWCVVDVVVAGGFSNTAEFGAAIGLPVNFAGAPAAGLIEWDAPVEYLLENYSTGKGAGEALVRYSRYYQEGAGSAVISNRVASLLVDLRELPPNSVVEFALFARLRTAIPSAAVDVVAGFYPAILEPAAFGTSHPDGAGVWTFGGDTDGRAKIGEAAVYAGLADTLLAMKGNLPEGERFFLMNELGFVRISPTTRIASFEAAVVNIIS